MVGGSTNDGRVQGPKAARPQLAHDLRNPLTVITGQVQLLRRRLRRREASPEDVAARLEPIEAALVRMAVLVTRLDNDEPA